jgi:hypothetical protein
LATRLGTSGPSALPHFEKSLKADPPFVEALTQAGHCDLLLENKSRANQRLRAALKLAPKPIDYEGKDRLESLEALVSKVPKK